MFAGMCLITVAWQAHSQFDLLLVANRDEYHARPTEPAHAWTSPPGLFAGRDIRAGGAWCGAGRDGRVAAVTNVREPDAPVAPCSRGALVRDYFAGAYDAASWAERVAAEGDRYAPFNLLVADREALYFVSNRAARAPRRLAPGVFAISNGHWGEHWPKTDAAEARLAGRIDADTVGVADLDDVLADIDPAPDAALPDTGIGQARERFLSPMFIRSPAYGTRATTVIRRSPGGGMDFMEQGFDPAGEAVHRVQDNWRIEIRST